MRIECVNTQRAPGGAGTTVNAREIPVVIRPSVIVFVLASLSVGYFFFSSFETH